MFSREIIIASLTTLENFTRGAIECFLTKTVLNLMDKVLPVPVHDIDLFHSLSSLCAHTLAWSEIFFFLCCTACLEQSPLQS